MNDPKSVLITGGTGRIGKVLVAHFLACGHVVVTTGRNKERLAEITDRAETSKLHFIEIDLEKEGAAAAIIDFLEKNHVKPNCLINNVRNLQHLKLNDRLMPDRRDWIGEFLLGVVAAYELAMGLTYMNGSALEAIINVASIYGIVAPNRRLYAEFAKDSPIHYGVVKAALIHLTKELAVRLADKNIRVNAVSYGGVEGRVDDQFKKRYAELCPNGRMLNDNDLIGAIDFLISQNSQAVTGHNLVVDGGWTAW